MRVILYVLVIMLSSFILVGQTTAKIISKSSEVLTIDLGANDGVKVGLEGKVLRPVVDQEGKTVSFFELGLFVVKKVNEDTSELNITKVTPNVSIWEAEQVVFYETLKKLDTGNRLARYKTNAKNLIRQWKFEAAEQILRIAIRLQPNDEEIKILLKGMELLNSPQISEPAYVEYKNQNPGASFLKNMKKKLYKNNPGLPPEKYLDEAVSANKNEKGYYELEFKNSHIMIYIKDMGLLVDKYEVSNAQYARNSTPQETMSKIEFTGPGLANYPGCCGNYPAVVNYEQAEKYCIAQGMRLPTEDEWEKIAGKDRGFKYSWGNGEVDEKGTYRANYESLDDGYIEVAPVDSFPGYTSPFGVVNLNGNVCEWVREKVCKGGGFLSEKEDLAIENWIPYPDYPGFRCVKEVEKGVEK